MELARKVTVSFLSQGVNLRGIEKDTYLGRIYGIASEVQKIPTQYGESEKFVGEFVGIRKDGKSCTAGITMLPSVATRAIAEVMVGNKGAKFGFDLYASPDKHNAAGYSWKVQSLMDISPVASMLDFAESFPAMPKDAEPVPETAQPEPKAQKAPKKS